jgi:hypothetical protein
MPDMPFVARDAFDPLLHMRRVVELPVIPTAGREAPPYELRLPLALLSIFCRHYGTSEALARVPFYCIAQLGLTQLPAILANLTAEARVSGDGDDDLADRIRPLARFGELMTYPLGQVVTDHAGYASFDLTPLYQEAVHRRLSALFTPLSKDLVAQRASNGAISDVLGNGKPQVGLVRLWVLPFVDIALAIDALSRGDV